jgi:hypothetical protein
MTSEKLTYLVDGLRKLRTGALLQLIAVIISVFALIYMFIVMGLGFMTLNPTMMASAFIGALASLILIGTLIGILLLVGFIYWFMSAGRLKEYDQRLGIGRTGVLLVVIGIILLIFGGAIAATSLLTLSKHMISEGIPYYGLAALGGFIAILGIGGILIFIGWILFSIMLMRLGDLEDVSGSIHTAGILYLIGVILSIIPYANFIGLILTLVAVILIYTGAGETLNRLGY